MWPTITTHQSAAARARAYSEAVRASTNANGNIVTLQQPPSSPRPSSTSTARTTPHKAHKKEIKTKSKRTIPASPTGTVPPSHAHPVARARHARRSSSASSSTSLGTRIRKEAAQVAAELLSNQAPAPAQQGAPKPPVEDVLAADGQAWMQFLQRTAAQLEQEVAKLPVEHVTTGSTRGMSSRSRHTTGSTVGSGVSRPESPLPTSTAAVLLSSSVGGALLLSDDVDAPAAATFLAGGGEGDTGPPGPTSTDTPAGTLSQLLRVLTDGPDSTPEVQEQRGSISRWSLEGSLPVTAPLALQEPQSDGAQEEFASKDANSKAARYSPDDSTLPTSPRQAPSTGMGAIGSGVGGSKNALLESSKDAKPLKNTVAGTRLIKNAPARSTATVRQLADALNAGLKVHKRWQREGRRRGQGSQRMVQAGVVDGRVVVDYSSGCWGRRTSSIVNRSESLAVFQHYAQTTTYSLELSLGEWKTVLLLHTNHGVLRLAPFTADACAEWVLGINTLLHLTAKELPASEAAIHLPWHRDVQVAADTPL